MSLRIGYVDSDVDRSLDDAVRSMFLKEKSDFTLRIKVNTTKNNLKVASGDIWIRLNCVITLERLENSVAIFKWTPAQKLEAAGVFKSSGVELFGQKRFFDAFLAFRQALTLARYS